MLRGQLGHLTRADEQHGRALERAENLPPQLDRREADGDGGSGYSGLAADALGDVQRVVHQSVDDAASRPRLDGQSVGAAHLSQDLRLTDDHRIQRRRDAEDVAHGGIVLVMIEMIAEIFGWNRARVAQEFDDAC